jgi:succinate dehydrogenase/fumarate reductase flavoprotein subunit
MRIDDVRREDLGECDLLILGAGAGGLATATVASRLGLKVILAEKESVVGGTAARSGGVVWVPNSRAAAAARIQDSPEKAKTYIRGHAGNCFNEQIVDTYLEHGPQALDFYERETDLHFELQALFPDYYAEAEGGLTGGRSLIAKHFDGRRLGEDIRKLRGTLPGGSFHGLQIGVLDYGYFLTSLRSFASFRYVVGAMAKLALDRARYGRSMSLKNGNALVAALISTLLRHDTKIVTSTPARSLIVEDGEVKGAILNFRGEPIRVTARRGVVLATGGFPHDRQRVAQLIPEIAHNPYMWKLIPDGNTGDGARLAESVGGHVDARMVKPSSLAPVIRTEDGEAQTGGFPLFMRHFPGMIAVLANGRRFVSEALSYHGFCLGMMAAGADTAFIIADHHALRRYGIGRIHPFPVGIGKHLRSGELIRGRTLSELAKAAGIDAAALEETVARYNTGARRFTDPDFHKGETAYGRAYGDPAAAHPNLGPLEESPFYAVKVHIGSLGTFAGIAINQHARALDADRQPIKGLYAVGNDAASFTGGHYIGAGITLGPALTFGYLAAHHAAGRAVAASQPAAKAGAVPRGAMA